MEGYILIIDDDQQARQVLSGIIDDLGLKTVTTSNGEEAVNQIEESLPRLIFLDPASSGQNNFRVANYLHDKAETRFLPIVIVTTQPPGQVDVTKWPGVASVIQKGEITVMGIKMLIFSTLGLGPFAQE